MKKEPAEDLRVRTRRFALDVIALFVRMPVRPETQVMAKQMLRSGTSVGAHYREACRARSDAEFISKLEGGLQELDETGYWLELPVESNSCDWPTTRELLRESDELVRILVTIVRKRKDR